MVIHILKKREKYEKIDGRTQEEEQEEEEEEEEINESMGRRRI